MFGVHSQRDRGAGTEPGQQEAERSRTAVGTAAVDRFVAAQRMASRVDAHTVGRFLTCHRGGGDGVVTVVAHQAILTLCASAGHAVTHAELRGQSLALRSLAAAGAAIISSLTSPPSRKPLSRGRRAQLHRHGNETCRPCSLRSSPAVDIVRRCRFLTSSRAPDPCARGYLCCWTGLLAPR